MGAKLIIAVLCYRLVSTSFPANERLLLKTYGVSLPEPCEFTTAPGTRDDSATAVRGMFHRVLLRDHIPLSVVGDGNCLFRALSRGLFGHERHHQLIRLLTALEIAQHQVYYDDQHNDYKDLVKDNRLIHDPYQQLLRSVSTPGPYSEVLVMFAASAALGL